MPLNSFSGSPAGISTVNLHVDEQQAGWEVKGTDGGVATHAVGI